MKRIIFLTLILTLMISACAAPTIIATSTPVPNTPIPTPTGTSAPSATPTSIPTPTAEKTPAQLWAEQNNGGYDADIGIAWDEDSGRVTWAKDANGEWIQYVDGNVPIPPGKEFENEPLLNVAFYKDINIALDNIKSRLGWNELAEIRRDAQQKDSEKIGFTYFFPIIFSGEWSPEIEGGRLDLHDSSNPLDKASIWIDSLPIPGGRVVLRINYQSAATNNFHENILVEGDPVEIISELRRIDNCVTQNKGESNLAELCTSDLVNVTKP